MLGKERKRTDNPEQLAVLGINDLNGYQTLDEKVEAIVENRNALVINNLGYIQRKRHINSKNDMCNDVFEGSPHPSQLSAYNQEGKDIPFRTVVRMATALGYTPEQLYSQRLDCLDADGFDTQKPTPRPPEEYRKYLGTYHMAYFANDAKLGANKRSTARSIANGVMTVYFGDPVDGVRNLEVLAFLYCTPEEQKELVHAVADAERRDNARAIRRCYEEVAMAKEPGTHETPRMHCLYKGHMTLTDRMVEITLRKVRGGDSVHLALHNQAAISAAGRKYSGGLATMMSTSRGLEHMPCIQAAILSKRGFNVALEELAKHLYLEPPTIDLQEETKAIVACMKDLFHGEDADSPLSYLTESDKIFMLEKFIVKKITEAIKHNVVNYYKVSVEMDSDLYKAICREQ